MNSENQPLQNIKVLVEYDGSNYAGFQQEAQRTIQGELNTAIYNIVHERPTINVAGRTDAGVHAMAQVFNFKTTSIMEARRFAPALNAHLPDDISVHSTEAVDDDFSARYHSKAKRYRYRVYRGSQPACLENRQAWHVRRRLDTDAMKRGADLLVGTHDFNAFRSKECDAPHAERAMHEISITEDPRPPAGERIEIVFHANAFCRHMCRILAGTLVEVGRGKREPNDIERILEGRDRTHAGVTAPPWGLTLLEVIY